MYSDNVGNSDQSIIIFTDESENEKENGSADESIVIHIDQSENEKKNAMKAISEILNKSK